MDQSTAAELRELRARIEVLEKELREIRELIRLTPLGRIEIPAKPKIPGL
jgi:hypothetical protein